MFLGYGKPRGIVELKSDNEKLYVFDYILTAGSRSSKGQKTYRIHVLNAKTGEKLRRFLTGNYSDFAHSHGDSLALSFSDRVTYYSTKTGKVLVTYSKETLPKLFTELNSGINNYRWDGDSKKIVIQTITGDNWALNIKNNKLMPVVKEEYRPLYSPSNKLYIDRDDIMLDDKAGGSYYLRMNSKDANSRQKYIFNKEKDSLLYKDSYFLDGSIVAINNENKSFIILHYETLTYEKMILTCISLTGKNKLWEIKQSDLNSTYKYRKNQTVKLDYNDQEKLLFFNIGIDQYALNVKDGKLVWKSLF